ncbi:hypothetical protein SISSUDRAFT_835705 [Sistotremastrum suecicum HHB10207 ss-3]|uniref:Uncharacterized protein n=1 Tax=Sistotremastrum suecicum HHB10207 ss-3 TaxID=1314776 RepID=A0A166CK56_9AGAM|nr:hypothetical protein SISSUDRAFT_835705 [Sistotremastrum suecicum HHB10207 ss-3]
MLPHTRSLFLISCRTERFKGLTPLWLGLHWTLGLKPRRGSPKFRLRRRLRSTFHGSASFCPLSRWRNQTFLGTMQALIEIIQYAIGFLRSCRVIGRTYLHERSGARRPD